MKTLLVVVALALGASPVQDAPPSPEKLEQHAWLQQLVGEWTVKSEVTMAPGTEPIRFDSKESVRSLGGLWILAEGNADLFGSPMTSIMTLGYDPAEKHFVGSWIDTMQTHLWTYEGTLDAAKKVLTLSATGPSMNDPTKTAKYRDAIEVKDKDHKSMTSSLENADGTWTTFCRVEYTRKK